MNNLNIGYYYELTEELPNIFYKKYNIYKKKWLKIVKMILPKYVYKYNIH